MLLFQPCNQFGTIHSASTGMSQHKGGCMCNQSQRWQNHYSEVIMNAMASLITSLTIVYSNVYSGRSMKTSKLHVTGLCAGNSPVTGEFPAQRPVTRKMFPFDDVIMMRGKCSLWINKKALSNNVKYWYQWCCLVLLMKENAPYMCCIIFK